MKVKTEISLTDTREMSIGCTEKPCGWHRKWQQKKDSELQIKPATLLANFCIRAEKWLYSVHEPISFNSLILWGLRSYSSFLETEAFLQRVNTKTGCLFKSWFMYHIFRTQTFRGQEAKGGWVWSGSWQTRWRKWLDPLESDFYFLSTLIFTFDF